MNEEALYRLTLTLFAALLTGAALYAIYERNILRLNDLHLSTRGKQAIGIGLVGLVLFALIMVRSLDLAPFWGFSLLALTVLTFVGGVALALHSPYFE